MFENFGAAHSTRAIHTKIRKRLEIMTGKCFSLQFTEAVEMPILEPHVVQLPYARCFPNSLIYRRGLVLLILLLFSIIFPPLPPSSVNFFLCEFKAQQIKVKIGKQRKIKGIMI